MKRRDFFARLGVGSAGIAAAAALAGRTASAKDQHDHSQVQGPLANATVSFGQWKTDPPLNRMSVPPPPPSTNSHLLIPYVATIKAGGSVNFIISGFHQVLVYAPGTALESISNSNVVPSNTGLPPLVDDPINRVFRGINAAATLPPNLDRIEVVQFPNPGTFLVVCGVLPHFNEGMHGFVKVLP